MKIDYRSLSKSKSPIGIYKKIGISFLVLGLIILALIWNTNSLKDFMLDENDEYATGITSQISDIISSHLEDFQVSLRLIADSVKKLDDDYDIQEFLKRKADFLEFDTMVLLSGDEIIYSNDNIIRNLQDLEGIKQSYKGKDYITKLDKQDFLFSVPVYDGNQEVAGVLAGLRRKEDMQKLLKTDSFNGSSLSLIVNQNGEVMIPPKDLEPFLSLQTIVDDRSDSKTIQNLNQLEEDIKNKKSGTFHFNDEDGNRIILSYHPISVNGWTLITMVPSAMIMNQTNQYIDRMVYIVTAICILFIVCLLLILSFFRKNREKLENIAFIDPLTEGYSNAAFQMKCEQLFQKAGDNAYTIVLLDVERFKLINRQYGTKAGDRTLCYIYKALTKHMKQNEVAARSDSDHFFLCLKETDTDRIQKRLDNIIKDINSYVRESEMYYSLVIRQGACVVTDVNEDVTILQDHARIALRMNSQRNVCGFYNDKVMHQMQKEQHLSAIFETSLKNGDFHVYLQPKVNLNDQTCGSAEALIRWIHPELGNISPQEFIPLFEKNDKIIQLDKFVFKEVCRYLHDRIEKGESALLISVNLSRRHFQDLSFLKEYAQIKESYKIPDGLIELELTESIFFDDQQIEIVRKAVDQMHEYGFCCSLDDFGVGFSSLGLLKYFNVDVIKLDRKFFDDIQLKKSQKIIRSFIEMAQEIQVKVVAEGIETKEQLAFLYETECNMVQGFIFSRPLSLENFDEWIQKQNKNISEI